MITNSAKKDNRQPSACPVRTLYCLIAMAACIAFGSGCGSSTTSDKTQKSYIMSTSIDLPVLVFVVTRDDGTGNLLWTQGYTEELLDTASALVGHAVTFTLAQYALVTATALYGGNQGALLPLARAQRSHGALAIVISRPDTTDSAGVTDQATKGGRTDPYFVMRSRHTDWSGINATAAILLHELGHNMGLYHKPETFLDDGAVHTDDWWLREDGIHLFTAYTQRIQ